ncbi:hypothetical protein Ahy_B06g080263 isoform A [Arachis hypogaea]|uniref:Uncharacterized protein n=1 Tax=Arachis hypogaea TaxID=3818 RepID=A0A444YHJ4_ARAHY|nr:hypothetical protein Ahy_B06g080263 isoform A [Arachis hypogaea]
MNSSFVNNSKSDKADHRYLCLMRHAGCSIFLIKNRFKATSSFESVSFTTVAFINNKTSFSLRLLISFMRDSFLTTNNSFSLRSSHICTFLLPFLFFFFDPCWRTGESTLVFITIGVSVFDDDEYCEFGLDCIGI